MRLWVWRGIRVELPEEWEMLLFSRQREAGRCAFADRYQFRLELSWRQARGRPDMDRMFSDYLSRLTLEGTMPDAREAENASFPGIEGHQDGMLTTRFGLYLDPAACLVELVFLWPEARELELEGAILASVGAEPPGKEGLQRWRAFGLDALTPQSLWLTECRNEPANAALTFADPRSRTIERFARLGMVDEWLDCSLEEWLRDQVPREATIASAKTTTENGHERVTLSGSRRPGFLRRAAPYAAAAWRCPADGRLYALSSSGPQGPPLGHRLSCCTQMELGA